MYSIIRYKEDYKNKWDSFIKSAKNTSFLFFRDFMEYHSNIYFDYSLMIFKNDDLIAVIPLNIKKKRVYSHQGLSYGGIILHEKIKLNEVKDIFKEVLQYLYANAIDSIVIKNIPRIYHTRVSDEIDWLFFKVNAKLTRRDTALIIDNMIEPIPYQARRVREIKKASKLNFTIKNGLNEFAPFWENILVPNLLLKYKVKPVHSINEIEKLATLFPDNIKHHNIYLEDTIVAGCTMFLNKNVAHVQYIASNDIGRKLGLLDYLFDKLIKTEYHLYRYFDFGICNEQEGQKINNGLLDWKEGFGARSVVHDFYEVDVKKDFLLND